MKKESQAGALDLPAKKKPGKGHTGARRGKCVADVAKIAQATLKTTRGVPTLLKPFTLAVGEFEMPSLGVAEDRARSCDEFAALSEDNGRTDDAKQYRERATWWRKLPDFSKDKAEQHYFDCESKARDVIDVLLARAETDDVAFVHLSLILSHVQRGLYALAAHENKLAGTLFANSICEGIKDFEMLANHAPKIFREWARKSYAIPGMISRNKERAKDNQRICEQLQQGKDFPMEILPTGKKGWESTVRANALAIDLHLYIQSARLAFPIHKSEAEINGEKLPAWLHDAVKLKPFSGRTWKDWAKVAWRVIAEISPDGKPQKHPAFYDGRTAINNVRTERTNPYYGNTENAPSIAEGDIREALFGAFEQIATGQSARKRQRDAKKKKVSAREPA